jgi:hypothetical protein
VCLVRTHKHGGEDCGDTASCSPDVGGGAGATMPLPARPAPRVMVPLETGRASMESVVMTQSATTVATGKVSFFVVEWGRGQRFASTEGMYDAG